MDYDNIEKTIDNFDKGLISRDRFLDYLKTQVEQGKNEYAQMERQLKASTDAAKIARQNVDRNTKQGVGTAKESGT